ncbi:MAG TPA: MBL fold metallo-hydrolase [Thermodesulfobacteriota bacterium]|nr:MBL fold metallo-hydrolase [Thermodesulfobacteriota bacterium]
MKLLNNLQVFIWRNPQANNCNTYLIQGDKNILIDPGHFQLFDHVRTGLADLGLTLEKIDLVFLTHGHPDHLEGALLFKAPTLITLSRMEAAFIDEWTGKYGGNAGYNFKADFFLQEGDLKIGEHTFQVLETPGHSPGSLCLYWPTEKALFTGDVVFDQGIGRTDLPGGNGSLLKTSIQKVAALDVEYLLSGHGEVVKGRKAVQENFRRIEELWFRYL